MSFKEVSCTTSQFIFHDILESFETKGVFAQLHGPSLAVSPRTLFLCRFPSMVNTERFSRNLFVVGEDEFQNILSLSLASTRSTFLFCFRPCLSCFTIGI